MDQGDFNPHLKAWVRPHPSQSAVRGSIDTPGAIANIVWQTRSHVPTEYENRLGDALEAIFEAGATELDDVVRQLNDRGLLTVDGIPWTTQSFADEMHRLATR